MTYNDFLHFLFALAVALIIVSVGFVFTLPDKKKCDKCSHRTKNGCGIIHWEKIENLNVNGNCGFYKDKGEQQL
jgi:hypothetical protein